MVQDPAGHLLVHFVEAPERHGEQAFFSLSDGPDPTRWTRVNGGRPVLESRIGTTGARETASATAPLSVASRQGRPRRRIGPRVPSCAMPAGALR